MAHLVLRMKRATPPRYIRGTGKDWDTNQVDMAKKFLDLDDIFAWLLMVGRNFEKDKYSDINLFTFLGLEIVRVETKVVETAIL